MGCKDALIRIKNSLSGKAFIAVRRPFQMANQIALLVYGKIIEKR